MIAIVCGCFFSIVCLAFPKQMYVVAESLNVRSGPTTDSAVAFKLNKNTQVEVLDTLKAWGAIQHPDYPGETFWISMDFLSDQPVAHSNNGTHTMDTDDLPMPQIILGIIVILVLLFTAPWFLIIGGLIIFVVGWLSG